MGTIEIKDEEIDVEEIMRKIRENIRKRKESGAIAEEMKDIIEAPLGPPPEEILTGNEDLQCNLEYINSNYNIRYDDYSISSHRRILGPFLIKGREWVHGEVRRYVGVIVAKQMEFNAHAVRAINKIAERIDQLLKLNERVDGIESAQAKYDSKIGEIEGAPAKIKEELAGRIEQISQTIEAQNRWIETVRKELFYELKYQSEIEIKKYRKIIEPRVVNPTNYQKKIKSMKGRLKVNLGCGTVTKKDYINIDMRELEGVDVVADVRKIPFEENSISELYSAHLIEHFTNYEMENITMPYWFSLIKKGGKIRIICPELDFMIRGYIKGTCPYKDFREVTFGTQEYNGNYHFNSFTFESLKKLLEKVGFRKVTLIEREKKSDTCLPRFGFEMEVEAIK